MNKKNFALIAIALMLAGIYAVCFTDWFRPKTIHIAETSRPARYTRNGTTASRLIFGLGDYYSLTEIKVVPLGALKTNKFAEPVWHLVSESGSDDVKEFIYGQKINGMDPVVEGARPEPLQTGVTYRIFVTAGKIRGQLDFPFGVAPASTQPPPANRN